MLFNYSLVDLKTSVYSSVLLPLILLSLLILTGESLAIKTKSQMQ